MREPHDHAAIVRTWVASAITGESQARMVQAFERAFGAMWRRAHATLGEVTLGAIVDRVVHDAAQKAPILATLKLGANGLDCAALRVSAPGLPPDRLAEALQSFLVQFLTILGNLTAGILSRALHSELSKLTSSATTPRDKAEQP